jgi:glycosyltransferase involved in cell wall biosynthesis
MQEFTIVIPLLNEAESIPILAREIEHSLNSSGESYEWECIWVDDGSTDGSWEELKRLKTPHKALKLHRNMGQSSAIMAGCDYASYDLIVTLDADLQNNPADIPRLLLELKDDIDCVCGIRKNRIDKLFSRKIPSLVANWLARRVTGVPVTDLGCTLRIFRKRLVIDNRLIGEMHRVLPIYFHLSGARIKEIAVDHRIRKFGASKYGLERIFKFIADIFLAKVMKRITTRPLYFFGSISATLLVSGILFIIIIASEVNTLKSDLQFPIGPVALIFGGIACISLSVLTTLIGLLTEVVIRKSNNQIEDFKYTLFGFK